MTVTPQGNIYICKTPLQSDYKNQLTFANAQKQQEYFNSVINYTFSNYTYIKKDSTIKVNESIDNLINCNYLFYRNNGFTDKIYYCFITDMEYINENCTLIRFETDVFQTWYFQINYKQCFVDREHVNDDTVGLHTVPENLETGEYIVNEKNYYDGLDSFKYVIQCTEWSGSSENKPLSTNFGGIIMAGGAYVCDTMQQVVNILQTFANRGKDDAVYNVYMIPSKFIVTSSSSLQYPGQTSPIYDNITINKNTNLNGYTPKNNKLLTYPYNYLLVSNNSGSSNILHYERFNGNCNFQIKGVPIVGGSFKIIPTNYDNTNNSEEEGLISGKFPTLNWSDDEYTNWLTQNSVNIGLGIASSGLTVIGGAGMILSGGGAVAGAGAIVSGGMSIANQLSAVYQHSLQPNSAKGNVNGGDINVCDKKNGFFFYKMCIKQEYAKIIDNYFTMFGYKVNSLKLPNINGRNNFNYVKTIDCNFDGDIPQIDLQLIRSMFNNGVTLWHNVNNMYNYDVDNSIV